MLDRLEREKKIVFITGDYNCNVLSRNILTEEFKDIFTSNHLYPLCNKPTRITKESSTLIDNIYCNIPNPANSVHSGLLHVNLADHKGLFCITHNIHVSTKNTDIKKRNLSIKNISKFNRSLQKETWDFINIESTQCAFTRFQRVVDHHFNISFEMETIAMTYKNRLPWLTE